MTTPLPSSFPLSPGLSSVIAGLSPSLREHGLLLVGVWLFSPFEDFSKLSEDVMLVPCVDGERGIFPVVAEVA
jgi:hypothetical protein